MILSYFTILILIGLLSYYLIFSSLSVPAKLQRKHEKISQISLIICAKNEQDNLQKFIPIWLKQEGIEYEIIVVNDGSKDNTAQVLESFNNDRLRTAYLDPKKKNGLKGKRAALLLGVQLAKYEYVVLTDADCYPRSAYHLKEMAAAFGENTEIVLGYSPYDEAPGLLGKLITYETTLTALQYLSFAKIGQPYMGVGRNVGYKKSILTETAIRESNLSNGGDDDLLVSAVADGKHTNIQLDSDTFVHTLPPLTWIAYFKQKQRHYSTARHYGYTKIITIGGFGALNILFYILMFTLLFNQVNVFLVLVLYLCKLILFVVLNYRNLTMLKVSAIIKHLWYLDVVFTFIFIFNHIRALKGKHGWS